MLGHEKYIVLKQGTLHFLTLPCFLPLRQCSHSADSAEHPAHDVVHTGTRTQRVTRTTGHVGQSAHHLNHFIQCGTVFIRPGEKAFVADVNEPRVQDFETGVVQSELFHGAWLEVLAHHVRRGNQPQNGLLAFCGVQIQCQTFLVAVEHGKEPSARTNQLPCCITMSALSDRLDFDHFCTQVSQHHTAGGPHHHMGEFHNPDA